MPLGVVLGCMWQFWYVLVLLAAVILMAPLKAAIRRNSTKQYGLFGGFCAISLVVCGAWSVVDQMGSNVKTGSDPFGVNESPFHLAHTFGFLLIVTCGLYLRKDRSTETSWLGWILLVYTHLLIAVMDVQRVGQFTLFFQIMTCGMVLYHAPVCGRAHLQEFLHGLWPIVVFLLAACVVHIRVSPNSFPQDVFDRTRIAFASFVFCAIFATLWCPNALERIYPDCVGACWRMGSVRCTSWLVRWSLTTYLVHFALWDAANIVYPEIDPTSPYFPLGAAGFVLATGIPFWFLAQREGAKISNKWEGKTS